jgi:hypothetical protein
LHGRPSSGAAIFIGGAPGRGTKKDRLPKEPVHDVPPNGIEPLTRGFSVLCSTD